MATMRSAGFFRQAIVLASLILVGGSQSVLAEKVAWRKDVRQAAREAKETKRPMLMMFTASWCHWCHKMLDQTYTDEQVAKHINACFIPVQVDADAEQRIYEAVALEGLPGTVIVSHDLEILKKIIGYKSAVALRKDLATVCVPPEPQAEAVAVQVAAEQTPAAEPETAVESGFAGNCLVTLLEEHKLQAGLQQHTAKYKGLSLQFASEASRQAFLANPDKYWPAWGGFCAVSAVDDNLVRKGDASLGAVYHGKLWFFSDEQHLQKFAAEPRKYLPPATEDARK